MLKALKTLAIVLLFSSYLTHANQCPTVDNIDQITQFLDKVIDHDNRDEIYYVNDKQFIKDNISEKVFRAYKECIAEKALINNISDLTQLEIVFKTLYLIVFYSTNTDALDQLEKTFSKIIKQRNASEDEITKMYQSYIRTRKFAKAFALQTTFKTTSWPKSFEINNLDDVSPNTKTVYSANFADSKLIQQHSDINEKNYVLVITSPICTPSSRFFKWLNSPEQRDFKKAFDQNVIYLVPSAGSLFYERWQEANRLSYPNELKLVHNRNQWPDIQLWDTPVFYFYKNGKLYSQLIGWPHSGNAKQLLMQMREIGLK